MLVCRPQRQGGLCGDEIHDSLGLGEIHLPVDESTLRKLPGLGGPRSRREQQLKNELRHEDASVTADLNDILTGIARWPLEESHEHFIDPVALGINHLSQVIVAGRHSLRPRSLLQNRARNFPGLCPGDTKDRNRSLTKRRCNRRYRILFHPSRTGFQPVTSGVKIEILGDNRPTTPTPP